MSNILLLEGPDCSGKSTFLNQIMEQDNVKKKHYGPFPHMHDAFDEYKRFLNCIQHEHVIIDRMHLSSAIYNPYTNKNDYSLIYYNEIDELCQEYGVTLIVFYPSWEVVKSHWQNNLDNELIQDEESMYNIYQAYSPDRVANITRLQPIYFDWTMGLLE